MEKVTYESAVLSIEELPKFTKKHSLEHTREFLRRLGNPQEKVKVIHVAGTNGKGSVCAYLQAILQAEGKKTGFFTSPHLKKINERIQLDRVEISDEAFTSIYERTKQAALQMEEEGLGHPSYFEFLFGMGMVAFAEAEVEYAILETGLGGRLDATNAIERPEATVITSISLDHTYILGDTIEEIAFEKAGIIGSGVYLCFDGGDRAASEVITARAEEMQAPFEVVEASKIRIVEHDTEHIAFSEGNAYDGDEVWSVPLCGTYQAVNALLAIHCAKQVLKIEKPDHMLWQKALHAVRWEGRMERIAEHFYLDGAHNPGAVQAFADTVECLQMKIDVLIFSAVSDKDYRKMCEMLAGELDVPRYIVTEIADSRKVDCEELASVMRQYTDRPVYICPAIEDACEKAYALRRDGEIFCVGSLYLVGMLKKQENVENV